MDNNTVRLAECRRFSVRVVVVALLLTAAVCACSSDTPDPGSAADTNLATTSVAINETSTEPSTTTSTEPSTTTSTSSVPAATAAPVTTTVPVSVTTASPDPSLIESVQYRYALTLPANADFRDFHSASQAWDGVGAIRRDSRYVDYVELADTTFFVFGLRNPGDLDSWTSAVLAHLGRVNRCSDPTNVRETAVAGVPARVFAQVCGGGDQFVRLTVVHEDLGLVAFMSAALGQEVATGDRLVELLDGLQWA